MADDFRWHVLSECPDGEGCPLHRRDETPEVAAVLDAMGLDCGGFLPRGLVLASNETGIHEIVRPA